MDNSQLGDLSNSKVEQAFVTLALLFARWLLSCMNTPPASTPASEDPLLEREEAMEVVKLKRTAFDARVKRGEIKKENNGSRKPMFRLSELQRYLRKNTKKR